MKHQVLAEGVGRMDAVKRVEPRVHEVYLGMLQMRGSTDTIEGTASSVNGHSETLIVNGKRYMEREDM